MGFALPPAYLNATKYTGDQISDVPCVDRPRAPTVTDINYPILTMWRNGDTNAVSPNAFGDLWYLAYFIGQTGTSYLAHWIKLSGGGGGFGPLVEINVPLGVTPIQPDGIGAITFTSTGGTVAITGSSANPNNHNINFDLTGGGLAVDSFTVQAATAPGLTTVTPDGLGNVVVNGNPVVNHLVPVETRSRALNAYNVEVQYAASNAGALATKSGLAHFDSSSFTVDPNTGYVTLAGGGLAVDSFQVQDVFAPGVQPVAPTGAGLITFNGAAVANHSVVLETSTRALNAMNVEVQYATTAVGSDATKSGVAHFSSVDFSVDANGFVQSTIPGGGGSVLSIDVDAHTAPGTDPVIPLIGVIKMTGAQVATGTIGANVIRTDSLAANTLTIEVQQSTTSVAKDTTKNGVAHFQSNQFGVDEGFVTLTGNNSSQPAFFAQRSVGVANVTGDATPYQVIFDTEIFDQSNSYNPATGVFTAPTTGTYLFTTNVLATNVNNALFTEGIIWIETTQRIIATNQISPFACCSISGAVIQVSLATNVVCQMTAGDTAVVKFFVATGPKTVGVGFQLATDPRTFFSGCKLC